MKILFLHGWHSVVGGVKPTYLKDAGHEVINPALDDDDFDAAVRTAQSEYDQHRPDVIVGSSRGGAVALNIESGETPLVLLCPAWKNWGTARTLKTNSVILHSRADDVIPFSDSEELIANSGLPSEMLIEIGIDHRLADPEPLAMMLEQCEGFGIIDPSQNASASENKNGVVQPMSENAEPSMEMMFSFFADVERKGPGSEPSTLKALSLLKDLPTNPRIVEFGCGTGVASIPLARSIECELTAVEIHHPFLDKLAENASRDGVGDRIKTVQADMEEPPFPEKSFDVIWSEAAIYNVGFEHGLRLWKPLLRSGGYIAVSEVVWLTEEQPQKAKEFWDSEYPSMTTVDGNLATMRKVGFNPVDHFVLPSDDWQSYYGPLQEHVTQYRSSHAGIHSAQALANSLQDEIDLWEECGDSFGYYFFIGRAY